MNAHDTAPGRAQPGPGGPLQRLHRLRRAALLACLACSAIALASCGGGAAAVALVGGVGTGGTGITFGTVVGLGSVIVDGRSYSSATPTYYDASGTTGDQATNSQAVELGARVEVQLGSGQQPSGLLIQPELQGAATQITSASMQVDGVRVLVNTNPAAGPVTFYSGLTGLTTGTAPLSRSASNQVEVHGAYGEDASGPYIFATLVEQLPASNALTRVTGVVSSVGSQSIGVAGTTIPLGPGTTVITPPGATLAAGELVHAWNTAGNWVVRVQALGSFTGAVQVAGVAYAVGPSGFTVSGIPVDTSSMSAGAQAPQQGDYVVVSGVGNGQGTLLAQSVTVFSASNPAQVDIRGTITGFVTTSSFQVRGVPIDASAFCSNNTAICGGNRLGNGVYVDIQGQVAQPDGNVVQASSVQVAPLEGQTVDLQGTISSVAGSGQFTLQWTPEQDGVQTTSYTEVTIAGNCAFVNGSASNLTVGAPVEVEGTYQNGSLSAYTLKFLKAGDAESSGTQDISGRVYDWNSGASTFMLEGNALTVPSGVSIPPGFGNGLQVEVSFTPSGSGASGIVKSISIDN